MQSLVAMASASRVLARVARYSLARDAVARGLWSPPVSADASTHAISFQGKPMFPPRHDYLEAG